MVIVMTGKINSKTHSHAAASGADATDMQIGLRPLSPSEFAGRCREIVRAHSGHDMHRAFDQETTKILCSLGYGEGAAIFIAAVLPLHPPRDARAPTFEGE